MLEPPANRQSSAPGASCTSPLIARPATFECDKPHVCCPHVIERLREISGRHFPSVSEPAKQVDGAYNPHAIPVLMRLDPAVINPDNIGLTSGELYEVEQHRFFWRRLVFSRDQWSIVRLRQ